MPIKRPAPTPKKEPLDWEAVLAWATARLPARWPPKLRRGVAIAGVAVVFALALCMVPAILFVVFFIMIGVTHVTH